MADKADSIGQRIAAYQPTKAVWFWTTVGAVVLTMAVGFTWGGWVTGGAAVERAEDAAQDAVVAFAADICAYRFLHGEGADVKLAALKEQPSYKRSTTLEENGWATFAGAEEPLRFASRACAERLMEAELPAATTPVAELDAEAVTPS